MVKPYYTSSSLISAVKRKASIPVAQVTFSDEDILAFANEELYLAQVPSILQYHEEYFVYTKETPLIPDISRYPLPGRAIGMKLRDIFYRDLQGQLRELSRINPDDKAGFITNTNISQTPLHYYLENNSIVIVPSIGTNTLGSFVFSFYLRPNALVTDDKAAICTSFSKIITIDSASMVAGDTFKFGSYTITAGTDFAIGVNDSITAGNITTCINALNSEFNAIANSNLITLDYHTRNTKFTTSNSTAFQIPITTSIVCASGVPTEITASSIVDFLQMEGGHSTYSYDMRPLSVSANSISFKDSDIPNDFVMGDYICLQYQCIVPQIPTDLHNLLAERTCARILEALGDQAGLQNANTKIKELEYSQATIIDSRVEGSPLKVLNTHSLLRYGKIRRGRW